MFQSLRASAASFIARIRAGIGRRSAGLILALLAEGLLTLALLTLAPPISRHKESEMTVFSFNAESMPDQPPAPPEHQSAEPKSVAKIVEPPPPPDPAEPPPIPPPLIELSRQQFASADISTLPSRPAPAAKAGPKMGPPGAASSGDTPRVEGSGPNGEPLYAASWYREPYEDELRGYLQTASGPGWALIACRTVPNFRVEDCVAMDEWPDRSNIARAVLAAAWQFRVRPPVFRGQPQVGEWVRIRIDYGLPRRSPR